jgi:predicted peptidase
LENEFTIDKKKRYILGESLGGYGTWHFICRRPDMFAAAVPVCGSGNSDLASKIVDVPIWAFHGKKDRSVPVKGSRDMIESIRNAGGDPRYTEFPEAGHIISSQVYGTPDLLDWLFSQEQE